MCFFSKNLPLLQHGKHTHTPHNSCLERIRSYATGFSESQSEISYSHITSEEFLSEHIYGWWLFCSRKGMALCIIVDFDLISKHTSEKIHCEEGKNTRHPQGAPKAVRILNFECSSYLLAHKNKCAIIVIFLGHGKLGKLAKLLFIDFAKPF